ncbi:DNA (cytosine-5-)-methyltransferase [Psychrosphaera aestuarii]|uniref:DNA (cytosine-5-)-methyltransferase n=1 Tax=Psychrosphaera aestuarii TaxID=1266052 RepID=UPI001B31F287|nr:DNA (cytosine-5-)-methyltransferase [Psychrosphaera aestuarii]
MYVKEIIQADKVAEERIHQQKNETDKLLKLLLTIYDQKTLALKLNCEETGLSLKEISREKLNAWKKAPSSSNILINEDTIEKIKLALLPQKPSHWDNPRFKFIDLFAGIGGLRKGFEEIGGKCVFTSEWDADARKTYLSNHFVDESELPYFVDTPEENPDKNQSFMDITQITKSSDHAFNEDERKQHILKHIPQHDVLLAGFPCQPFSLAGVSKKNSLGRAHGFECETQGTLFFDVEKVLEARKPRFFVLENVKNLKNHDKGNTFATIIRALDKLGYFISDVTDQGSNIEEAIAVVRKRKPEPIIIDGAKFTPQHRERVVIVGIRKDLLKSKPEFAQFSLKDVARFYPESRLTLAEVLCELKEEQRKKYTLTENLWSYLYHYALKHQTKGNGFGFGMVDPTDPNATTRTLSARYYKDGSEILINQNGVEQDYLDDNKPAAIEKNQEREAFAVEYANSKKESEPNCTVDEYKLWIKEAEKAYDQEKGRYSPSFDASYKTPRRLTPKECARLMGFEKPEKYRQSEFDTDFRIVCADNKAYKQFGNSVVVPVFRSVAKLLEPLIKKY